MRNGGLVALLFPLSACASPQAVLLAGEDGHPTGALAVLDGKGGEKVLDQPLASARLGRGRTSVRTVGRITPAQEQLIATLPPPARSFTLNFYEGTTTMTPESRPVLDQIRVEIARRPGAEVQVTGHTDTLGSDDDNDRLSTQRANEIMGALITEGFARELMSAVGRGERDPAVQTGDGVENPQNRRVEVIVR